MARILILLLQLLSAFSAFAQNYPVENFSPYNEQYRQLKVHTVTDWEYHQKVTNTYDRQGRLVRKEYADTGRKVSSYQYVRKGDTLFCLPEGYNEQMPIGKKYYLFSKKKQLLEYGEITVGAYRAVFPEMDYSLYMIYMKRKFSYNKSGQMIGEAYFENGDHKLEEYEAGHVPTPVLELKQEYAYAYDNDGKVLLRRETIGGPDRLKTDSFYYDGNKRISRIVQWQDQGLIGCLVKKNMRTEWVMKWKGNVRTVIESFMYEEGELMVGREETMEETWQGPGRLQTGRRKIAKDGTPGAPQAIDYTFYP